MTSPNPNLRLYFCTLDTCVSYYLVAAEFASDCFDIIERSENIRAVGAYQAALSVEFADARHLTDHDIRNRQGVPIFMAILQYIQSPQVVWSSEWEIP